MQHLDAGERDAEPPSAPPIRIKLGMKHTRELATYSSSEEDTPKDRSPPAKKQKTKRAKQDSKEPKEPKEKEGSKESTMPAQHRKTYDWLQPSSASASHHGPPERERHPSTADETTPTSIPVSSPAPEPKPKKKRRSEPGPGKNWRKGLKKGDPRPPHLTDGIRSSPLSARGSARGSVSRDPSPDIGKLFGVSC